MSSWKSVVEDHVVYVLEADKDFPDGVICQLIGPIKDPNVKRRAAKISQAPVMAKALQKIDDQVSEVYQGVITELDGMDNIREIARQALAGLEPSDGS